MCKWGEGEFAGKPHTHTLTHTNTNRLPCAQHTHARTRLPICLPSRSRHSSLLMLLQVCLSQRVFVYLLLFFNLFHHDTHTHTHKYVHTCTCVSHISIFILISLFVGIDSKRKIYFNKERRLVLWGISRWHDSCFSASDSDIEGSESRSGRRWRSCGHLIMPCTGGGMLKL